MSRHADIVAALEAERSWRQTRIERLECLAGRVEGLSDSQQEEVEYTYGLVHGLDFALRELHRVDEGVRR